MIRQIEEYRVRKWVKQILEEEALVFSHKKLVLTEQRISHQEFSKAFLDPFKNVLTAAQIGLKDIATSLKFNWDMLVTFDPKKLHEKRQNYKTRMEKIKGEYTKLNEKMAEGMGADVKMASFLLNPGGYLASSALKNTWKSKGDVADWFREVGFGGPSKKEKEESPDEMKKAKGILGSVFDGLRGLFFMGPLESRLLDNPLLLEVGEEEKTETPKDKKASDDVSAESVSNTMEDMGVDESLEGAARGLLDATEESIDELSEMFQPSFEVVQKIWSAEDLEGLMTAIKEAKAAGLDLGGTSESQIQADIDKEIDNTLADEEKKSKIIEAIAKREKIKPNADGEFPEIPEDKLREEMGKIFFANASESVREAMEESGKTLEEQFMTELNALKEEVGLDDESQELIQKTSMGKELINLFDDALTNLKQG